ncbi:MAG: CHAT domain-containing protein [Pseudorhodobacter sp.]|nr:CHAT domain-containing protein [Pseudorhodobacter sp.]
MPARMFCLFLAFLLATAQLHAEAGPDPRLDLALQQADQEDWQGARATAEAAAKDAKTPEQSFDVRETLATIAQWQGDDAGALAILEPLLADGAALFGPESPRLILSLRMLAISESNLGNDAAAVRAQIRALRLARTAMAQGGGEPDIETQLLTLADLARSYIDLGQNAAAALLAAEAEIVAAYDAGGERPEAQEAHVLRALAHLRLGHWVEAVLQALPVYRLQDADFTAEAAELRGLFDTELAEAAGRQGVAQEVTDRWLSEALLRESARNADTQAMTGELLPMMQALQNNDMLAADQAARIAFQSVLADDPVVINAYFALLTGTVAGGQFDLAVAWAERMAGVAPGYLASLQLDPRQPFQKVANWLIDNGRPADAIPLARSISDVARLRDGEDSYGVQLGLTLQGEAERRAGLWEDARRNLDAAVAVAERASPDAPRGGDRAKIKVQSLVQLGLLAEDQGQTDAAEAAYTDAIATLQSTDAGADSKGWSLVLGQLGALYATAGRLDAAEALLKQSLDLAERQGDENRRDVALSLYELARLQIYAGNLEAAQPTAARALRVALASMVPNDPQLATIYLMQAELLGRVGQPDQAREMMARALAVGQSGDAAAKAALLMQQAVLSTNDGDAGYGRKLMAEAISATPPEDPIYANLEAAAGAIALKDNDLPAALALFRRATATLTQADRRFEPSARDHLPLHVDTARRMEQAAEGSAAINLMAEAFAVAQRVNDISAGDALNKATARRHGGTAALSDLARGLETDAAAVRASRATLLAALAKGQSGTNERTAFAAAQSAYAKAQSAIAASFPRYAAYADPKPQDMLATMRLLGPDEVLVLFATSDMTGFNDADSSSVIALTNAGYVAAGLPARAEVEALARALRCAAALTDRHCGTGSGKTRGAFNQDADATEASPDFDLALAYQAYATLLDPVSAAFKGKSTLIVVPDKALAAMPFHLMLTAAPDPQTGLRDAPWLIRQMAVMVVPTVASLASLRSAEAEASTATKPFLGIGDPLIGASRGGSLPYDCASPPEPGLLVAALVPPADPVLRGGDLADTQALAALAALPETRCELQSIARLLGTPDALLLEAQATEAEVKRLSDRGDLSSYRVLSFATHGLIAGEIGANNAGLVLTPPSQPDAQDDGLLTTAEIANLRLDADFVLLSACNTAAGATGRDEGLSGLASAFFLAGARSLLVSHWPVYSDAATRLTTATFDQAAANPGIGRAEALRRAMLAVLDDPQATPAMLHPAWWGPFMIAGEGGTGRQDLGAKIWALKEGRWPGVRARTGCGRTPMA